MIRRLFLLALAAMALACAGAVPLQAQQQQTEPRIAFVVGNSTYGPGAIPNALNDAGLVAEALRSLGFEIVEGGNLSQPDFIQGYREFLGKVEAAGPETLAFVYFSGHALSFEGENFLLGVDAQLARESDIPIQGIRLSDLMRPLADAPSRAKVMMIDAARPLPFRPQGRGLAIGLASIEPPQGMLIAYSSAPGTVVPDRPGDYGAYATAIAEMLRAPGVDLDTAFTHIRSRTHLTTEGQQTPWHLSAISEPIELVPPTAAASAAVAAPPPPRQARPMREIGPDEAYSLAIEMDTLDGYTGFVEAYPGHPYSERVWAMIRARREAMAWMRAQQINTPQSYWTYLRRYPNGMYAFDAERRLRRIGAPFAPPQGFAMVEFDDVPMALVDEPREYREVYRVGPRPPRILYQAAIPAFIAALAVARRDGGRDDWRRDGRRGDGRDGRRGDGRWGGRGSGSLPTTVVAIPAVQGLTAAPRRDGTPGTGRPGGYRPRDGFAGRPPGGGSGGATPSTTPGTAIAPSTVSPSPGTMPGRQPSWTPGAAPSRGPEPSATVTPGSPPVDQQPGMQRDRRPPGWGPPGSAGRPPSGAPGAAPGTTTPGTAVAPSAVSPSATAPSTAAPGAPPRTRHDWRDRRPPGSAPPPSTAVAPSTVSPSAVSPSPATPSATAPSAPPRGRPDWRDRRPPDSAPPPASVSRTPPPTPTPQVVRPPVSPPPAAIARPTPPQQPVVRQAPPPVQRAAPPPPPPQRQAAPPPPRQAAPPPPVQRAAPPPPPPQRQAAPPPPPRPAPAAAPKPAACPAGKSMKNGACV
jgi:hypothetical protein